MCTTRATQAATCELAPVFGELERQLEELVANPAWDAWLDLLVVLHRLPPSSLRDHLRQQGRGQRWPQVEALRINLRQLAAEDEPMSGQQRVARLRQVGRALLGELRG